MPCGRVEHWELRAYANAEPEQYWAFNPTYYQDPAALQDARLRDCWISCFGVAAALPSLSLAVSCQVRLTVP